MESPCALRIALHCSATRLDVVESYGRGIGLRGFGLWPVDIRAPTSSLTDAVHCQCLGEDADDTGRSVLRSTPTPTFDLLSRFSQGFASGVDFRPLPPRMWS